MGKIKTDPPKPYKEKDYKGTKEFSIRRHERDLIVVVLNKCKNKYVSANVLDISYKSLYVKIINHRIRANTQEVYSSDNKNF